MLRNQLLEKIPPSPLAHHIKAEFCQHYIVRLPYQNNAIEASVCYNQPACPFYRGCNGSAAAWMDVATDIGHGKERTSRSYPRYRVLYGRLSTTLSVLVPVDCELEKKRRSATWFLQIYVISLWHPIYNQIGERATILAIHSKVMAPRNDYLCITPLC